MLLYTVYVINSLHLLIRKTMSIR